MIRYRRRLAPLWVQAAVVVVLLSAAQLLFSSRGGVEAGPRADPREPLPEARALGERFEQRPLTVRGPSYDPAVLQEPTGDDSQSKLWFHSGSWWGVLFESQSGQWRIHELDEARQVWRDTGTAVDDRARSSSDALWDGARLYVITGGHGSSPQDALRLFRFSFDPGLRRHTLDPGFPIKVKDRGARSVTIAKDTMGQLWLAYVDDGRLLVNRTLGADTDWGAPFTPPVAGTDGVAKQAAIIAHGSRVRVVWSNGEDAFFHCAQHRDDSDDDEWTATSEAIPDGRLSDDHLNLAALDTDEQGRLFVAAKTATPEGNALPRTAPLVLLLVIDDGGRWESHVFGQAGDDHTRPVVLVDEDNGTVHMFATAPTGGGAIYHKASPIDEISFGTGRGTPVITSLEDAEATNATSTKQTVSSETGIVVLAADDSTGRYLHGVMSLGGRDR